MWQILGPLPPPLQQLLIWAVKFLDIYMILASWGRLVQWENVRLPMQRSRFASHLRQMILLSCRV